MVVCIGIDYKVNISVSGQPIVLLDLEHVLSLFVGSLSLAHVHFKVSNFKGRVRGGDFESAVFDLLDVAVLNVAVARVPLRLEMAGNR